MGSKEKTSFSYELGKIYHNLNCMLKEHSPIPESELIIIICVLMDIITNDDIDVDSDLALTRLDMAEMIYKEWPHTVEYYNKNEPIIDEQTERDCEE